VSKSRTKTRPDKRQEKETSGTSGIMDRPKRIWRKRRKGHHAVKKGIDLRKETSGRALYATLHLSPSGEK